MCYLTFVLWILIALGSSKRNRLIGSRVKLQNLVKRKNLNGQKGTVDGIDESGKLKISLDKNLLTLKSGNLELIGRKYTNNHMVVPDNLDEETRSKYLEPEPHASSTLRSYACDPDSKESKTAEKLRHNRLQKVSNKNLSMKKLQIHLSYFGDAMLPSKKKAYKKFPAYVQTEKIWEHILKKVENAGKSIPLEKWLIKTVLEDAWAYLEKSKLKAWTIEERIGGSIMENGDRLPAKDPSLQALALKSEFARQIMILHDCLEHIASTAVQAYLKEKHISEYEAAAIYLFTRPGPFMFMEVIQGHLAFNPKSGLGPTKAKQVLPLIPEEYAELFVLLFSALRKMRVRIRPNEAILKGYLNIDASNMLGFGFKTRHRKNPTLSRGYRFSDYDTMVEFSKHETTKTSFQFRGYSTNYQHACVSSFGTKVGVGAAAYVEPQDVDKKVGEVMGCQWENSFIHALQPRGQVLVSEVWKLSAFPEDFEHVFLPGTTFQKNNGELFYAQRPKSECASRKEPGCAGSYSIARTAKKSFCGFVDAFWPEEFERQSLSEWIEEYKTCPISAKSKSVQVSLASTRGETTWITISWGFFSVVIFTLLVLRYRCRETDATQPLLK